ncbi:MAG: transporter substrate-binding domain-containing protein, partial [Deltaproteobacteria bacterium]|nr:transporter substrate-binding domain-containing protein [Deltaproteobacteria bacterium]
MKPASMELKRLRHLIVLWLFPFLFIPWIMGGEDSPVPNSSTQRKSQLKSVIVDDYYPYTFVNKEGVPDGFSVDLVKAVAKVMGMELEIEVDTWDRAMRNLETGEIDFLPKMSYSKERDKLFDFSVPHTIAFDALFTRKDSKRLNTIEDLKGHTVIVMKGDQAHDYLRSSGLVDSEYLILIDSLPEALRLLSSGKGDAALMPKLVGLTLVNDLKLTNLTQSPAVVESYNRPYSFAVKKGNLLLLERLSQGLSIIKKTGQYREIYDKWFGTLEPKELTLKSALKYIVGMLLVLLLIGSAFALW